MTNRQIRGRLSESKHSEFMALALEASRQALPQCRPNPPVGCVLVRQGEVIASAFTQAPGQAHAEAGALVQLQGDGQGVAAYVTLEPCAFHGRTPSCAKALIAAGIAEVYVAVRDPDPRNNGKGIQLLQQAGISVVEGVLVDEVSAFIAPYLLTESC